MNDCGICPYKLKAQSLMLQDKFNAHVELITACTHCRQRTLQNCLSEIKRRQNENKRFNK